MAKFQASWSTLRVYILSLKVASWGLKNVEQTAGSQLRRHSSSSALDRFTLYKLLPDAVHDCVERYYGEFGDKEWPL